MFRFTFIQGLLIFLLAIPTLAVTWYVGQRLKYVAYWKSKFEEYTKKIRTIGE
jgi:hypothetical protein